MSDASFYKWKAKFGGMEVSDARRLRELESENSKLIAWHGKPFGISLDYIRPGKPNDNAFIKSFSGWQRDECMIENLFSTFAEARELIEDRKQHYNQRRTTFSSKLAETNRICSHKTQRNGRGCMKIQSHRN